MEVRKIHLNQSTVEHVRSDLVENLTSNSEFEVTDRDKDYIKMKFGNWFSFGKNQRGKAIIKLQKESNSIDIEMSYVAHIVGLIIVYIFFLYMGIILFLIMPFFGMIYFVFGLFIAIWDYKNIKKTTDDKFGELVNIINKLDRWNKNKTISDPHRPREKAHEISHRTRVEEKMECPHCGRMISRNSKFCTYCGEKITE